jgi:rubredoxin
MPPPEHGKWTDVDVRPGCECPGCGELRVARLRWIDDDLVSCQTCLAIYDPNTRRIAGSEADACLHCGEVRPARQEWSADGRVRCKSCGTTYNPDTGEIHRRGNAQLKGHDDDRR